MPRKDVWIKKADIEKWEALENKSEWVHVHLNLKNRRIYTAPMGMSGTGQDEAVVTIPKPSEWSGPIFRDKRKSKL